MFTLNDDTHKQCMRTWQDVYGRCDWYCHLINNSLYSCSRTWLTLWRQLMLVSLTWTTFIFWRQTTSVSLRNDFDPLKRQYTIIGAATAYIIIIYVQKYICKCIVPQNVNVLPCWYILFVLVIRFITKRKYASFCIYLVRLSADNDNPYPSDKKWPCTVINDQDWQLGNCP